MIGVLLASAVVGAGAVGRLLSSGFYYWRHHCRRWIAVAEADRAYGQKA